MRIIAGTHKGRRLQAPTWSGLRPTSDKLRETLFNILSPRVSDARVLDLYAGTGAVALEALSRGAARAVCIERDHRAVKLIETNRAALGELDRCIIVCDDAARALDTPVAGGPFDVIVLDPPYEATGVEDVLTRAAAQRAPGAALVLEHASRRLPPAPPGLAAVRTVKSGDSALTFSA
jgi:16S rRNA (guanine(966)-N(2))-methyltransferase RsmD